MAAKFYLKRMLARGATTVIASGTLAECQTAMDKANLDYQSPGYLYIEPNRAEVE